VLQLTHWKVIAGAENHARITGEAAMETDTGTRSPVFTVGRMVLWLVLVLMLTAIAYSAWHVVANWRYITV
jgi:hypothetical protein